MCVPTPAAVSELRAGEDAGGAGARGCLAKWCGAWGLRSKSG